MPEGQYSGKRTTFNYSMDDGTEIQLVLDDTLGSLPGLDLVPAVAGDGSVSKPARFQPRGVFWQGVLDGAARRKFLVCNPTSAVYLSNGSVGLEVDGVQGSTTGRKGEKFTFAKVQNLPSS